MATPSKEINLKKKQGRLKKYLLITLHAIVVFACFWYWLGLSYSYEADSKIYMFCQWTKNLVFSEPPPDSSRFVFIDVSTDKSLVDLQDEEGIPTGNIAITNRKHLAALLEALAESNTHQYILLDVFLEDSTADDSTLQAAFKKVKRCIQPYHFDGTKHPKLSRFSLESGLAEYNSDFGNFFKYQYLQHDTCRTVPLVMYENIYKKKLEKRAGLYFLDNVISLNTHVLDFRIRQFNLTQNRFVQDVNSDTVMLNFVPMYSLASLPPPILSTFVKEYQNKIIVIGDFLDRDIHNTNYGPTAGPLIQLNAFLALEKGDMQLHWYGLFTLFAIIWLLCLFMPFLDNPESIPLFAKVRRGRLSMVFQVLQYALILGVFSMIFYLISGIYINSMILGFYFGLREDIQEFFRSFFRKS